MKAIVVTPTKKDSLRLLDIEDPVLRKNQILLRVLKVGICGTDRDIISGFYGEPPAGSEDLVLGHESLCRVASFGESVTGFRRNELVVPTVRRPCPENCLNCRNHESDFCLTGHYKEHGIKQLNGFASDMSVSDASFVVRLPEELSETGVLLEPLTIVEKGMIQSFTIQSSRMKWRPRSALVLGAGPVGLLATAILRLGNFKVETVATRSADSLKAELVKLIGANYINSKDTDIHSLDYKYDFVFEATGNPSVALEAQEFIGQNGIVCYLGIYRQDQESEDVGKLFTEMVLGNKVHFGSVNANKTYFEKGARDLVRIKRRWPGFLDKMITKRANPSDLLKAYSPETQEEVKTIIEFS